MNAIPIENVRNFAIMGHTASGKTSLVDALLFKMGLNDRLGAVDNGSSAADYTDEEKHRKITVFPKPFMGAAKTAAGKDLSLTFIDTPGYMDFFGGVVAACRATETCLIAVDAVAGVQVGTRQAWKESVRQGRARAIVITGIDRENANFEKVLGDVQTAFGKNCVPVTIPAGAGVSDVLGAKPAAGIEAHKNRLIELAAETDDTLIEKFLGGEALTDDEVARGLRNAVARGGLVPVFACAAPKDRGLAELVDNIARLFPSPLDLPGKDAAGKAIAAKPSDPFVGFVWRVVNDPFVGQLTFVRVLGGTLKTDSELLNAGKDQKERIGGVLVVNGKKPGPTAAATAGDIVALAKLKFTSVADTLCAPGHKAVCAPIAFPNPVAFAAVRAKTQADEDKLGVALARVCEDDPTLKVERNRETKETILQGLGDVHLDVAVGLMKSRTNVDVLLSTPRVPYRETVTGRGEGHYKHKKQTGGRGQYGEVYLRVEPRRADEPDWFVDAVVGGVIPNNFIPAVQKGLAENMHAGALAGYPITDVKITLYDGSYHDVDSSEIAFKIAAARAMKDGMTKAKPVLLEPIMTVRVMIPEHNMGDITGDLNHKRGRIMGMESDEGLQVIVAEVPHAELFRYAAELRSITGGQGSFEMKFCRYDVVPSNIAQKVIAEAKKDKQEEEE